MTCITNVKYVLIMGMVAVGGTMSDTRSRKTEKASITVISSESFSPLSHGRKRARLPSRESAMHGMMIFVT